MSGIMIENTTYDESDDYKEDITGLDECDLSVPWFDGLPHSHSSTPEPIPFDYTMSTKEEGNVNDVIDFIKHNNRFRSVGDFIPLLR
jgi:hypothetical protein